MRKISKGLAIAVTVAAIGGASLVAFAQTGGPGSGPGYGYGPMGYGMMGFAHGAGGYGMMGGRGGTGFADPAARLDALKTELAIRPEQSAAWGGYVNAVQDSTTKLQTARSSIDFDTLRTMNWADHQAYMGKLYDQRAAAFRTVHNAAITLLAALDDTQKARVVLPELENVGFGTMGYGGYGMMGGGGYGMMGWGPGAR